MKGFTLLEVMVALAIMSGVILTVISTYNFHLGLISRDKQETEAMLMARAKLDEPNFLTQKETAGTFAPQRPDLAWKITRTPAEGLPSIDRLTFTVSWDNERHALTLAKYLEHTALQ